MNDLDNNGRRYKCGPNWVPDRVFDEPIFNDCCKEHDINWEEGTKCKCCSDFSLLCCCWKQAENEKGWSKLRARAQAVLMYSILLLNPVSYIVYYIAKKHRKHG